MQHRQLPHRLERSVQPRSNPYKSFPVSTGQHNCRPADKIVDVNQKADLFSYEIDGGRKKYLEMLDGKLLLVTNTDLEAGEVVSRYKSLAVIERGFRVLKSDIEIGPVYHRLPRRIRAHALVCFMALILYRVMRMRLQAANRGESPTTLLAQFKRIQQQTVQTEDGQSLNGITEINEGVN